MLACTACAWTSAYSFSCVLITSSQLWTPCASTLSLVMFLVQVRKLGRCITLEELKAHAQGALAGMPLLTRGRLSVQPVTPEQWAFILGLEDQDPEKPA